jgi:hypothetical protein
MKNPINIVSCGHTFETSSLSEWFKITHQCPICRKMSKRGFQPNLVLKDIIRVFK